MTETEDGLALSAVTTLAPLVELAARYAVEDRAPNTRRAYSAALRGYRAWAAEHQGPDLDPHTVSLYLAHRAESGTAVATLGIALAAITKAFAEAGLPNPRQAAPVKRVLDGIRRRYGTAPTRQARALGIDDLRRMCRSGKGLVGARDAALLLVGFAGAFRRSELAALDVTDVADDANGFVVTLRRSKTDQHGAGRKVPIPFGSDPKTCPVRALRAWLDASGSPTEGPLFRSVLRGNRLTSNRLHGRDVTRLVQRAARRARVRVERLSGHSLRSGFITAAARAGKSIASIARTTGHKSHAVLAGYIRNETLFDDCAATGIGL